MGLVILEAAALQAVGFVSAVPMAPQISAPAPFGTFHDLRWVWTFASSPLSWAWMVLAALAFRSVVTAALVALAWPDSSPRPGLPTLLRRSLAFTVLATAVLSPWATLTFITGATGFSPLMFGAVVGATVTLLLLTPSMITGSWWRPVLRLRSIGWTLLLWLGLMLVAAAVTFSPGWLGVLVAAAGGAVNAWAWRGVVRTATAGTGTVLTEGAAAGPGSTAATEVGPGGDGPGAGPGSGASVAAVRDGRPPRTAPGWPLVPVAASAALLAGVGYLFGSSLVADPGNAEPPAAGPVEDEDIAVTVPGGTQPVVYVAGFGSQYDGTPARMFGDEFATVRFSYAGLGPAGEPLPYDDQDTYQSLERSAAILAQQIEQLHEATGEPVSVVAESEGTLVARTMFAAVADPPVDVYVQTSPLIRPARVYYPQPGQQGFGYAGGWAARAVLALFRAEVPALELTADMPFLRSVVTDAPLYRDHILCPVPGVRTAMLLPLEGGLTVYRGPLSRIEWWALPAFHASILEDSGVQEDIAAVLAGEGGDRIAWQAAFQMIRGASGAWQSPALPLQLRPEWDADADADPAFGEWECAPADPG